MHAKLWQQWNLDQQVAIPNEAILEGAQEVVNTKDR